MSPDELLWNGIFWDLAELIEIWPLLKVDVEAVTEADLLLSEETSGVDSERVLNFAAALLEACQHSLPRLLSEPHALEHLLYLLLLIFSVIVAF